MTITSRNLTAAGLIALGTLGLGASSAVAQESQANDAAEAQAFGQAQVTLMDAITAAEAQGGGKAMSAEFDPGDDGEPSAYDVDVVMPDGTVMGLVVNAVDGTVTPDAQDGNGDQDDDNGEGDDEDSDEG